MSESMSENELATPSRSDDLTDFPPQARAFLNAFYKAKRTETDLGKIAALRGGLSLEFAKVTGDPENELKVLEFYFLTKMGAI